jgi:hypothetical protein
MGRNVDMSLKLLEYIPDTLEEATRLLGKTTKYWEATLTDNIMSRDSTLCMLVLTPTVINNKAYTNTWKFKVILCRNPFTGIVYGLMQDRKQRNEPVVYGICALNNSEEVVWSGTEYYKEYRHSFSVYSVIETAFRDWIKRLTCP